MGSPGWVSAPARGAEPSRWTARLALLVAFLACILAVIGWFRPVAEPVAPQYSEEEVAAAKEKVCGAFELVDRALKHSTNADSGGDLYLGQILANNARVALIASSATMRDVLGAEVAYPLARKVEEFASVTDQMAIRYLAGEHEGDSNLAELRAEGESLAVQLREDCRSS